MTPELHLPTGTYILVKASDAINQLIPKDQDAYIKMALSMDKGKYELIGPVSSITEEQAKEIMPYFEDDHGTRKYADYSKCTRALTIYSLDTALESFHSWLKANKIYTGNPYGKEAPKYDVSKSDGSASAYLDWKNAEKTTGSWVILKKAKQ